MELRDFWVGRTQLEHFKMHLKSILALLTLLFVSWGIGSNWVEAGNGTGGKESEARLLSNQSRLACADARAAECRGDFEIADRRWWDAVRTAGKKGGSEADLADALYGQSQFYTRTAEYEKAISVLKRFIRLKRDNRDKTYFYLTLHDCELADLYYYQHKWQDAAELYLDISRVWKDSRRWPMLIPVLDRLGVCFQRLGKKEEAEARYKEALEIWKKARVIRGLESQVLLMDYLSAETLEHYAAFLTEGGKEELAKKSIAEADTIWRRLAAESAVAAEEKAAANHAAFVSTVLKRNKVAVPADVMKKVSLAEKLAFSCCRAGKYFESETLYDIILSLLAKQLDTGGSEEPSLRHQVLVAVCQSKKASRQIDPPYSVKQAAGNGRAFDNPYLVEFNKLRSREDFLSKRTALVSKFAYAVPTAEGLAVFQRFQPILEIGAGTGYWAASLRKAGTKIAAYELYPLSLGKNAWHPQATKSWTEVLRGDESMSSLFPKSTLFMCYPPGRTRVAYNALQGYKGNRLIYVGETAGLAPGAGQDSFQNLLAGDWQLESQIHQPQWPGLYDCLYVYKRKHASSAANK
jgi:tetratricopeptide (TPR) repeat protein